ncbi:MAG: hypothetical protein A4E19_13125 [Nitrospira sp. SG-bin1]|nr:MAG: hypothetical protein A4E19_13125 [Nitrospira sp. SG-bin1]
MDNWPEVAYYAVIMSSDTAMSIRLPPECETALLERFLKAEAMALWTVRSARVQDVPLNVSVFLRKHEEDEQEHLARFEAMIGRQPRERERLPSVPRQWPALAVQLYGYESLGLEFATLLVALRPDLTLIREDELVHVEFFEREIRRIIQVEGVDAEQARISARAWWRKLPRTVDRYLDATALEPYRQPLARRILVAIERRFDASGLLQG